MWLSARCLSLLTVLTLFLPATPIAGTPPDLTFALTRPDGWGPVALAVIRTRPGRYIEYVPACDGPEEPDEICLGYTVFEHPGRVIRLLAKSADFADPDQEHRFRKKSGHHAVRVGGGTMIALLEKTEKGYTWVPWTNGIEKRMACFSRELIDKFKLVVPRDARISEDGSRCVRI